MAAMKFVVLGLATSVSAWGQLGHATVGYIAQNYLDAATATWAKSLLNDQSASYLASVASYADDYRSTAAGKWSAPLHFIDAEDSPPTNCNVDYERDCGASGCVVSAIANYTTRVVNTRLSVADQAEALKFLVHFIGDISQPLHDEALALGGNQIKVTFDGYANDNLHSDWDTYIPQKLVGGSKLTDAATWSSELIADIDSGKFSATKANWIAGDDIKQPVVTGTRWAADGNALVCSVVMPNGVAALQTGDLYPDYYNSVVPTIEMQIAKAGYRLANWLNKLYASANGQTCKEKLISRRAIAHADLSGHSFLPAPRALSEAKKKRELFGCDCGDKH